MGPEPAAGAPRVALGPDHRLCQTRGLGQGDETRVTGVQQRGLEQPSIGKVGVPQQATIAVAGLTRRLQADALAVDKAGQGVPCLLRRQPGAAGRQMQRRDRRFDVGQAHRAAVCQNEGMARADLGDMRLHCLFGLANGRRRQKQQPQPDSEGLA